ncbi:segregation and condensation protein A [Chitinimonas koreensis]|uniref:segregation and condensation protein A n=1 Tax=Chitinimonas koreensis TaxID=356302 RepID=UPI00040B79D8|nr:ScpA family protein [Chitinimonas koreensis]QNM94738.1 segregation/condensation protein A [Chitinimonas koreensis]
MSGLAEPLTAPLPDAAAVPAEPGPAAPIALLFGQPVTELPADLYIPPEALRVLLERFEGPLDLLLYLIRKQNLDILDIPMAVVTAQYMDYVDAMRTGRLELAAEYLLMAAMLIEIKSRMLLPRPAAVEGGEADPRAELVRRLLEYEQMKLAAFELDQLPQAGRDFAWVAAAFDRELVERLPEVSPVDLKHAWLALLARARHNKHHTVKPDELSVREQMGEILKQLAGGRYLEFTALFDTARGIPMLVVSFIAVLELTKEGLIAVSQAEPYAPIYVRLAGLEPAVLEAAEAA